MNVLEHLGKQYKSAVSLSGCVETPMTYLGNAWVNEYDDFPDVTQSLRPASLLHRRATFSGRTSKNPFSNDVATNGTTADSESTCNSNLMNFRLNSNSRRRMSAPEIFNVPHKQRNRSGSVSFSVLPASTGSSSWRGITPSESSMGTNMVSGMGIPFGAELGVTRHSESRLLTRRSNKANLMKYMSRHMNEETRKTLLTLDMMVKEK